MKLKTNFVGIVIALTLSLPVFAGEGGREGHGGDAVVCFSVPLSDAVNEKGLMTKLGRASIVSATPLELFLANRSKIKSGSLIDLLKDEDYNTAEDLLHGYFKKVPSFYRLLEKTRRSIGRITDGRPAVDGLVDIKDSDLVIALPDRCASIQAVVRRYFEISYDPDIFENFSPFEEAVMSVHERIYLLAKKLGKETSVSTQVIIAAVLAHRVSNIRLAELLRIAEFGSFHTLSVEIANIDKYINFLDETTPLVEQVYDLRIQFDSRASLRDNPGIAQEMARKKRRLNELRWHGLPPYRGKDSIPALSRTTDVISSSLHRLVDPDIDLFPKKDRRELLKTAKESYEEKVQVIKDFEETLAQYDRDLREKYLY